MSKFVLFFCLIHFQEKVIVGLMYRYEYDDARTEHAQNESEVAFFTNNDMSLTSLKCENTSTYRVQSAKQQ